MSSKFRLIVLLLGAAAGIRVLGMYLIPFIDTSEPRYAEIARLMVETGNWVTPWFTPDVPFWGKPPLSFWAQAAAFHLLGVNEFAARLPSLVAVSLVGGLILAYVRIVSDPASAKLALWIFATSLLSFVAAGAVLTDPFLTLGTTLSMVAFRLAMLSSSVAWGYGFFAGIAIGLLAKGPLAIVLTLGPLIMWSIWVRRQPATLRRLPWFGGGLLLVVLVLPWYAMAEIRTPGFLRYFVLGEHLLRFIEPGWKGDLYGSAHLKPFGAIWWNWGLAAFPWSLLPLLTLFRLVRRQTGQPDVQAFVGNEAKYMVSWAVFPLFFFTFAHNILWTYVLPGLPAFAVLGAWLIRARGYSIASRGVIATGAVVPTVCLVLTLLVQSAPDRVKTERELIAYAMRREAGGDARLIYVETMPFSARFYSAGKAERVALRDLPGKLENGDGPVNLVVPKSEFEAFSQLIPSGWRLAYENKRYYLVVIFPAGVRETATKLVLSSCPHA